MKKLKDEVGKINTHEQITATELRRAVGAILAMVELGKTYTITKSGQPIAVLSKPPGTTLAMVVDSQGAVSYKL